MIRCFSLYIQVCFPLYFLLLHWLAPNTLDKGYIISVLIGVFAMLIIHYYTCYITRYDRRVVSIRNMCELFFVIVYFQLPLDYVLGYDVRMNWFYKDSIFCGALNFSALCLSLFLLGYSVLQVPKKVSESSSHIRFPYVWPFVILAWLCFLLFVQRMGFSFFIGGYGAEGDGSIIGDGGAARFFNYMQLFLKAVVVMVVWNVYNSKENVNGVLNYLKLFPSPFMLLYLSIILLWFTAGGRAVSVTLFLFLYCGYILLSKKDLSLLYAFVLIIIGGVFFSLFKILGGLSLSHYEGVDVFDAISHGYTLYQSYSENVTLFSPTRELAFSIYTYNVYYYWWTIGHIYGGLFLLLSLLGSIPFLTPLISQIIGVDLNFYYLAKIVTEYDNADFGLGSSCVGELLCDVGFLATLLLFFLFGLLFRKLDTIFQDRHKRFNLFLVVLSFSYFSTIFFAPRGSIVSGLTSSIFLYLVMEFYALLLRRKNV